MPEPRIRGNLLPNVARDEERRRQVAALQAEMFSRNEAANRAALPQQPAQQPARQPAQRGMNMRMHLENRVYPYVKQEDYDHPYYEEAMQWQEMMARQGINTEHARKMEAAQGLLLASVQPKTN